MKSRAKDMREEMRGKEGGKGDGGCPFFFTSGPLARASPRVLASLVLFATRKGKLARRLTCY